MSDRILFVPIGFINVTRQYLQNHSMNIRWYLQALKKLEALPETRNRAHKGWYACDAKDGHRSSSIFRYNSFEWPDMLSHYIEKHNYQPPDSFITLLKLISL